MNDTKTKILSSLKELYTSCKQNKYFLLEGRKEDDVRQEITDKLINDGLINKNDNILELYLIITQINNDVMIQI